jgi:hypothetical protein
MSTSNWRTPFKRKLRFPTPVDPQSRQQGPQISHPFLEMFSKMKHVTPSTTREPVEVPQVPPVISEDDDVSLPSSI